MAIFNASFDTRFLDAETRRSRRLTTFTAPPHVCMMYLRPALGIGKRIGLSDALIAETLPVPDHRAAHDALATALLWERYHTRAQSDGICTFGDIADRRTYKFMQSWTTTPYDAARALDIGPPEPGATLMPRMTELNYPPGRGAESLSRQTDTPHLGEAVRGNRRATYLQALIDARRTQVSRPMRSMRSWLCRSESG